MSVDLRSNSMFARISLLLMDDCLIKLEHGRTKDRVRRYSYDRIESVIIYRNVAWGRMILWLTILFLPGVLVLFIGETFSTVTGTILIAVSTLLVGWCLYCKKTTIRIIRAGQSYELREFSGPADSGDFAIG